MGTDNNITCPASGCAFDGTVSQVIRHVTNQENITHTWESLGFQNSHQFRETNTSKSNSDTADMNPENSGDNLEIDAAGKIACQQDPKSNKHSEEEDTKGNGGPPSDSGESGVEGTFPQEMIENDQWLLWKQTDDGRKIPRAPWKTGDALRYVSAMDPENRTSFSEAVRWRSKLPHNVELAYVITGDDDIVFLDLDNVVIDDNPSPAAQALIDKADSYTALSTSGTGVHILGHGSLSDDVKSLTGQLTDAGDQTLEVYDRNRFIAMTGNHLSGTATQLSSVDALLTQLENEFASVSNEAPDRATVEPQRSRDELSDVEMTDDIQDIFDAISQTRPSDITMRSTQTREHGDGTYSYDPSWVYSESGTRLGVVDDVWIYRKGMIALDALQVVALEEGIISNEQDYPAGEAFWDAVDALRRRGAHIPEFEPYNDPIDERESEDAEISKWKVAKRLNYGNSVRIHVHPYDRDYQERLALKLAPDLVEAAESLHLSPTVVYRAAELYAKGHAAGIVPGAAHESSLGAALRIASIEAGTPRPLSDIGSTLKENPNSIEQKYYRLIQETNILEIFDAADLVVSPPEYVPYIARQLGKADDDDLCERVHQFLDNAESGGSSNPMTEVAAAFYAAMKTSSEYSITQGRIGNVADLSKVTIRNNYKKFMFRN